MKMRLIGRLQNSMPMDLKIEVERNYQAKELVLYTENCQYPLLKKRKGNYILLALFFGASAILFCCFIIIWIGHLEELQVFHSSGHRTIRSLEHKSEKGQLTEVNRSFLDDLQYDFCHSPEEPILGLEGFVPTGFKLQQTHILIIPGEITPNISGKITLNATRSTPLYCEQADCRFGAFNRLNPKLKVFQEKINRDERFLKEFESYVTNDLGCHNELSPIGIQRLVSLGEFVKDVYLKDLKLESSLIQPKHIKLSRNEESITAKSSLAFLFGMLSEGHLRKFNTSVVSRNLCSEKHGMSHVDCNCPGLYRTEQKFKQQLIHGLEKGDNSHLPLTVLRQILSNSCLHPNFSCFVQNGLDGIGIIKELFKKENAFYEQLSNDVDFVDFVNVYLYPFMNNLIQTFRHADYVFEKLFLHFVDESFMFYMLNVLKLPKINWPRPGSRIVFELYKKSGQVFQPYYVRILFNGANVSKFVPLCDIHSESGLCRLKNFAELLHIKTSTKKNLHSAYQSYC
ncbi:2-phosphoxylose phosphatase 1-like [Mytilus trossulus]|uniref:2-phosphoxylose phosphatase 1-like n=1 Tax=Mytilus trossulus TaxID=6551 RepID=UPI00300493D9